MADRPSSAAVALTGIALAWGLFNYGATEAWSVHALCVLLAAPALLAVWGLPATPLWQRWRLLFLLAGACILSQVAWRPSLAARGYTLAAVVWLALLVAVWTSSLSRQAQVAWVVLLVSAGAFEAAYGLVQSLGGVDYIGSYFRDRGGAASGTFIASNHYAGFLNLIWPLAAALVLARPAREGGRRLGAAASRVFAAALTAASWLAVLLGRSRGGALALAAAAAFLAVLILSRRLRWHGPARRLAAVGAATLVGVMGLVGTGIAFRRYDTLDPGVRSAVYADTLRLIGDEPLGVGPGMYVWRFRPYQTGEPDKLFDHAHNDYLELAVDWGLPVALLLWGLIGWRLVRAARLALTAEDPWRRALALGCSGSLASLVAHSVVDFNLHIPATAMVFAAVVGLAWGLDLEQELGRGGEPRRAGRVWAIRLISTLLLLAAGGQAFQRLVALRMAEVFPTRDGLEGALAWDPSEPDLHFRLGLLRRDHLEVRDLEEARRSLERATQLNPWAWRYRMEIARLYEITGDDEGAEREWMAACARNPIGADYHWRLGNFQLRQGSLERALPSLARALALKPALFASTALVAVKAGATGEQLDRLLVGDRASRHRLLQLLVAQERETGAPGPSTALIGRQWREWMASSTPPQPDEGAFYVSHLLRRGAFAEARRILIDLWEESGGAPLDYRLGRNVVWNPTFDDRPSRTELDWTLSSRGSVMAQVVPGAGRDGSSALRIVLDGAADTELRRLRQWVVLGPEGEHRLSFAVRWEGLTAAIFLEASELEDRGLRWRSEGFSGSGGWRSVEAELVGAEAGQGLALRWRAERSSQLLSGTLWLDDLAVRPQQPSL